MIYIFFTLVMLIPGVVYADVIVPDDYTIISGLFISPFIIVLTFIIVLFIISYIYRIMKKRKKNLDKKNFYIIGIVVAVLLYATAFSIICITRLSIPEDKRCDYAYHCKCMTEESETCSCWFTNPDRSISIIECPSNHK